MHLGAEPGAVDQGQRSDALRVGQRQAERERPACGVSDQVQRRVDAEGVEERAHEAGQVGAGGVVADGRGGFAVARLGSRSRPATC